jgi:2-polyprenyl-3-methyl-5-hydroxy-6-metoxy-1,4-benzoquinol methylase
VSRPPDLDRALSAYFDNESNVGHADRVDAGPDGDPVGYVESIVRLRQREIATWKQRWGSHLQVEPRRILDAGCGPGFVSAALAREYPEAEVVGVDVEPEGIAVAEALGAAEPRMRFEQLALEDLDTSLGTFDLIICRTVLEHVRDPRRSLDRLISVLAPGGALFLETPNYLFPREPHLGVWMLPGGRPRWLLRRTCVKRGLPPNWAEHLQFSCDHVRLSRWAARDEVRVINLMAEKVRRLIGGTEELTGTGLRGRLLRVARGVGPLATALGGVADRAPFWPSVQLLIVRDPGRYPSD